MPEVKFLHFSMREILVLMIQKADVHEGKYKLALSLSPPGAGWFGASPDTLTPGFTMKLDELVLEKVEPGDQMAQRSSNCIVDASEVNPSSGKLLS
jgi:hypothetical protein